jgi:peptidoglycan/xylan/chitin deacetylase (PgdA/CDA1 family)
MSQASDVPRRSSDQVAGAAAAGVSRPIVACESRQRGTRDRFWPSYPFSPASLAGFAAFGSAAALLVFGSRLAPLPLLGFLLACALAPFWPAVGFFLPIVSRGRPGARGVALTFDDGPDPEITPRLLDLLDERGVAATFFVTGEKAAAHPELIWEIILRGHAIGNHSYSHLPFLMLTGMRTLRREVKAAQTTLARFGVVPLAFRPPVGVTNPHLWSVLLEEGMYCLNFSCRAPDWGNRRIDRLSARVLGKIAPGDIVALHDVAPARASAEQYLSEIECLIHGLRARGLEITPLARLIGRDVMRRVTPGGKEGLP